MKIEDYISLDQLPFGTDAKITHVDSQTAVSRRLMEMGLVPGAAIATVKSAPFGDPIQVKIKGYNLALRKNEAQGILVTRT